MVEEKYPVSTVVEGTVARILKMGIAVTFGDNIEGVVHATDIAWGEAGKHDLNKYNIGDPVKAVVLAIDPDKGRINLGIKQLTSDPFEESFKNIKRGSTVTCTVKSVNHSGLNVEIGNGVEAFIAKSDLSNDKIEQRPDRFSVGDRVDAQVIDIDKINRAIHISIKALEIAEQKQKISEYGSASSGASLGDILGKAISVTAAKEPKVKEKAKPKAVKEKTKETTEKKAKSKKE